jgi:hypothetical protein
MLRPIQAFIDTFVQIGIFVLFDKICCIQYAITKVFNNKSRWKGGIEDADLVNYFHFNYLGGTHYALLSESR